jgi:hypothetical protein
MAMNPEGGGAIKQGFTVNKFKNLTLKKIMS